MIQAISRDNGKMFGFKPQLKIGQLHNISQINLQLESSSLAQNAQNIWIFETIAGIIFRKD